MPLKRVLVLLSFILNLYFYNPDKWIYIRIWLNICNIFFLRYFLRKKLKKYHTRNDNIGSIFSYRNMMYGSSLLRKSFSSRTTDILTIRRCFTLYIPVTGIRKIRTKNYCTMILCSTRKDRTCKKNPKSTEKE